LLPLLIGMTGDMPASEFDLAAGFSEDLDSEPADERVYRVALQLYEPAGVSDVAERAACAPDTARRHLNRLADIGVVEAVSESPPRMPETSRTSSDSSETVWRAFDILPALKREDSPVGVRLCRFPGGNLRVRTLFVGTFLRVWYLRPFVVVPLEPYRPCHRPYCFYVPSEERL